jgi:signal transduction histidine kinase
MDPEDGLSRQNLQEIKVNGENLLNLINNLLDLAKIEAGRYQLNLETVDMVDVIGSVERVIAPLAMKKGIDFKTRFMEEIPLLKADPEKIHRVVENLAGNAVKFTPQGGKVEIKVDFDRETQTVLVEVNDTGIGIKEEDQERIFERFVQVDNSNSRRYRGTGLGLALAKELVEMHGGWIRVSSRPEEGSTFTVGLPVAASLEEGKDG